MNLIQTFEISHEDYCHEDDFLLEFTISTETVRLI